MAVPDEIAARVDALREQIRYHNERYYELDAPEITDADYDALVIELRALEEEYPELVTPDSPTQQVGAARVGARSRRSSTGVPMMSPRQRVRRRRARRRGASGSSAAGRGRRGGRSVRVRAQDRRAGDVAALRERASRAGRHPGDGRVGEDVTANVAHDRRAARSGCRRARPTVLEVRGEVYMPLAAFEELNERQAEAGRAAVRQPAQLGRRVAAPEGPGDHRAAASCRSGATSSARS